MDRTTGVLFALRQWHSSTGRRATRDGVPIVIVNLGPTRVDGLAAAKVEGRVGEVLPALAVELLRV